jgi:uncharacterized membrane protein
MRQLFVELPEDGWDRLTNLIDDYEILNIWRVGMPHSADKGELVILHASNQHVEAVLEDLREFGDAKVTLNPDDVLIFNPPYTEATESIINLDERTAIEVYLDGLRSIGSWRSYLLYAIAAAIVVWIGLFTDSFMALVAAVLIAPFGSPAMNAALATARGDGTLLVNSVVRYIAGILVAVAVSSGLTLIVGQAQVTDFMVRAASLSAVSFLLPVVTGAIGAHNLFQTEGSSLVPGTAVGALVAASIVPAAGVVGMAIGVGHWEMVDNGLYLLLLQLVAINLGGMLVFRLYGIKAVKSRYQYGKKWLLPAVAALTTLMLGGLLVWQFSQPSTVQTASRDERMALQIRKVVEDTPGAQVLRVDVTPTAEGLYLAEVYTRIDDDTTRDELRPTLERQIRAVGEHTEGITLSLDLTLLD